MPETSQKWFWLPEGPGGRVNVGHRGDSFLIIYIFAILAKFLQTWAEPGVRVIGGKARGASFLQICILGITIIKSQNFTAITVHENLIRNTPELEDLP